MCVARRLALLLPSLLLIHLLGFGYAWIAKRAQGEHSPFGAAPSVSISAELGAYVGRVVQGDFGTMPRNQGSVASHVLTALVRSLIVLVLAFTLSGAAGLALGLASAQQNPARLAAWLFPLTTVTQSVPSFYFGVLLVALLVSLAFNAVPVQVLALRPAVQITQITASLIVGEADKQYVIAARGVGHSLSSARRMHILPNVSAPMVQSLAGAFRLLVAELVVAEWLFNWPGVGRLLATTLVVPRRTDTVAPFFLHPELTAMTVTALAALFMLADLLAHIAARAADPRLRAAAQRVGEGASA
jgi:peptide/nickel transport system permease protein